MTRALAAGAALAAGLALAACGEDRTASTSTATTTPPRPARPQPPPRPPTARVTVAETEYRLDPARIRVDRPATLEIVVRNRGRERHALDVEGPSGEARTRTLAPGESETLRVELDRPGRYRWYCPVDGHAARGMRGWVAVGRGG